MNYIFVKIFKLKIILLLIIINNKLIFGQLGARSFEFLNYTNTSRANGLGSYDFSAIDSSIDFSISNPAFVDSNFENNISLSYVNYISGSHFGNIAFTKKIKKIGPVNFNLFYANYGKFDYTDEYFNNLGSFYSNDFVFNFGYALPQFRKLRTGINAKLFYSKYFNYDAFGIGADIITTYIINPNNVMALKLQNIVFGLNKYSKNETFAIPFNSIFSFSKKLKHAPFRFTIVYDNVTKFKQLYNDNLIFSSSALNNSETIKYSNTQHLISHFIFGTEILIDKISVQLGYNIKRRMQISQSKIPNKISGFSFGFGLNLYKYGFNYSLSSYHSSSYIHNFTFRTNLNKFF